MVAGRVGDAACAILSNEVCEVVCGLLANQNESLRVPVTAYGVRRVKIFFALFGGAAAGLLAWAAIIWIIVTFFASGGHEGGTATGAVIIGIAGALPAAFVGSLIGTVVYAIRDGRNKPPPSPRSGDQSD